MVLGDMRDKMGWVLRAKEEEGEMEEARPLYTWRGQVKVGWGQVLDLCDLSESTDLPLALLLVVSNPLSSLIPVSRVQSRPRYPSSIFSRSSPSAF